MGLIEGTCLDCRRLNSAPDPCPYKDNRLILKSRLWVRGISVLGPLGDEEKRRLRLLSSICIGFTNEPQARVGEGKDRIAAMRRAGRTREVGMKWKRETEFISTGEAAEMIGISRSTVQYYFEVKILKRKKHPITGWRSVSRKGILTFMKEKGMKWGE